MMMKNILAVVALVVTSTNGFMVNPATKSSVRSASKLTVGLGPLNGGVEGSALTPSRYQTVDIDNPWGGATGSYMGRNRYFSRNVGMSNGYWGGDYDRGYYNDYNRGYGYNNGYNYNNYNRYNNALVRPGPGAYNNYGPAYSARTYSGTSSYNNGYYNNGYNNGYYGNGYRNGYGNGYGNMYNTYGARTNYVNGYGNGYSNNGYGRNYNGYDRYQINGYGNGYNNYGGNMYNRGPTYSARVNRNGYYGRDYNYDYDFGTRRSYNNGVLMRQSNYNNYDYDYGMRRPTSRYQMRGYGY
jgi:hypothetical protein